MTFKTLQTVYKMLQERVLDLEQERAEVYEEMQLTEGLYEVAVDTGDIEAEKKHYKESEEMNKEYEKK